MAAPNQITVPQLLRQIGRPQAPVLVDICLAEDFRADPYLVPGALRHDHDDPDGLIDYLDGRACVVICQKGLKLSQGLVAWLRGDGIDARYLQGGMYGWRDHPETARIPAATLPPPMAGGGTLWVTRHRPRVDRIACPWLIRRFVDRRARFLFVSPGAVAGVAERFGATPFGTGDGVWSHRGDGCTFDTMLDMFGLRIPALDRLSLIVRAAGTDRHDLAPQAAGLLALSVGQSRLYRDDHQQLQAGMGLYDALYLWARDGFDEGHDHAVGATA
ncbi:chromate resistance protein ChrB domain-containing protein [Sedimentitalea sp. HM32M-2]|uniref:chromate resistance protein ChrB domain-containing protein n=1 Tax=Sedimentitalea sp. HM32M-2 TaxID=3351566 RepID=UPI0036306DFE